MPKRHLSVQNKGNEHEEHIQSSNITTRLSLKRTNIDETIPNKISKIEEKQLDKENVPKRKTRQNTKSKEPEQPPLPPPVIIIEPTPDETTNDELEILDDDDNEEEEEEEEEERPTAPDDNGKDYPSNKQYVIYENIGPNKEPFIISKTARYWNHKYRKVVNHVNPDAYGMYIHNDFWNYGELEVVENCLLDLTKAVFTIQQGLFRTNYIRKPADKINYVLGFRRLEALTILLNYTDGIGGIDDGERFNNIIRVIGACYVTILRGLLPQDMFNKIGNIDKNLVKKLNKISKQIPNFKQVLEQSLIIGYQFQTIGDVCSAYTNILQIIYCNWVLIMDKITIDLNKKPKNIKEELWTALKHASQIDENDIENDENETFDFMKELRLYKEQYGLGGDSHDLSKWSRAQREVYSLNRFDSFDNDDDFWF